MRARRTPQPSPRRLIASPLASALLAALLILDLASLPAGSTQARSIIASALTRALHDAPAPPGRLLPPPTQAHAVRTPDGIIFIDTETESWDRLAAIVQRSPDDACLLTYRPSRVSTGLWAITRTVESHVVHAHPYAEPFTQDELAHARTLLLPLIARDWSPAHAGIVAKGDRVTTRIHWTGYAHNALALSLLVLFLASLAWIPRAPAAIRARLAARALARKRCPACAYSIASLDAPRCPECGTPLPPTGTQSKPAAPPPPHG